MNSDDWRAQVDRLREMAPRGILFLCVSNSARSQMAEGIGRALAPPGVEVFSAGTAPSGVVHPMAIRAMREIGIDILGQRSKDVSKIPASKVDTVITLCAEEACPMWLGQAHRLHWGLPDPAAVVGSDSEVLSAFRAVRDELLKRLERLFNRRHTVSSNPPAPTPSK